MTLKEVRELLKSGKPIQFKSYETWELVKEDETLNFSNPSSRYRIAPEPRLRPWKPEEAIGKVIRNKNPKCYISTVTDSSIDCFYTVTHGWRSCEWYLENCEQLDGSPCGVMEGEQ